MGVTGRLPSPRFEPRRLDRAFAVLAGQVDRGDLPAAALAVASADGVVRAEAFAGSDAGVTLGHRFRIASVTKPIVATVVMQLVEEGRLTLGTPIRTWLPTFAPGPSEPGRPGGEVVTPWHILSHTSGSDDAEWVPTSGPPPTADDLFRGVCERPLRFVPGTAFHYASDTFFVLGELIRTLGGHPSLAVALEERIFGPLGMTATGFESAAAGRPTAPAHVVGRDDATTALLAAWFASVTHPGGGLWSNAADLVAFGRAILLGGTLDDQRILGTQAVELMTREHTAGLLVFGVDPPRAPTYGLGWGKPTLDGRLPGSPSTADHMGASGSRLWVDPGHGLVIALLANVWGVGSELSGAVIGAIYGALETD